MCFDTPDEYDRRERDDDIRRVDPLKTTRDPTDSSRPLWKSTDR
jgi:hypothetical protein